MKKDSVALRLFLYASLVSLIWLGSYMLLSGIFSVPETEQELPSENVTPAANLPETSGTQWSVLAVVNGERDVTGFFLRYADFFADTLVFVEVPVNTKAELATGGYEVLSVHNPELPEIFMVSDMCRIFSEETWCMAAEEVGTALLGIRPKECYVLEQAVFERLTETTDGQIKFVPMDSVKETLTDIVEHAVTDDTLRDELVYLESYLDLDDIFYRRLPGEASAEEYHPDLNEIHRMTEAFRAGMFEE